MSVLLYNTTLGPTRFLDFSNTTGFPLSKVLEVKKQVSSRELSPDSCPAESLNC